MPSNHKKIAANRANSKKSTGPQNTTSTRFNSTKHGLLSAGITELDNADGYRKSLCRLHEAYAAEMSDFLMEQIALHMVRLRRIARLEAEQITSVLNPAVYGEVENDLLRDVLLLAAPLVDPGLPASMSSETVTVLVSSYQRYRNSIENGLYRAMHEVERIERIQQGERLPVPVVVDVAVHSDHHDAATNVESPKMVPEDSQSEPAGEREADTKPDDESS